MSVVIKFTKKQVETFLKHWDGCIEDWYLEEPKGEELKDLKIVERFFNKLKIAVNRS